MRGTLVLIAAGTLWHLSCASVEKCEPATFGYADAQRVKFRVLPAPDAKPEACARARTDVIAAAEDLNQLYKELNLSSPDVDFTRERVIVREGPAGGTVWAVAAGETAILGLRACEESALGSSCVVEIVAVESIVRGAETRTCEPVFCGVQPGATNIPRL
jgi:hypothetical protein